ncbi:hypothetical protein PC129_g24373 [Phytophthora cactorum]|uniref:Homeodomain-like n=1 Tax=Phytophthora cactorum TaxID=29920 RepID=A0A8T1GS89_9STRA|nr:hypothetical protein PC114_g9394 [Phytophthora cactorum]KAG2985540.1 hypothetical protein PC118_g8297 [Phytophthora cactorum]KAG3022629.1 hypothetical protein PC119_g9221 [Phytophthora cactorum]KAG3198356.1 hypothetical protein PC129_g24373 [Phytophthora cactorum]
MRTSFADAEDKLLVQIAFQFEREGLRITWDYVVRRMKTKRPARQFRLRLASLKRTYGKSISGFPPCFLGGLYSRRLLSAPGLPPPPRVSQRPARPNRVHSSPPAHVQGLSVRQGGQCDRGDHPAVATAASGAVVGDGDADDNTITSVGSAISQSVAAELQGQQSHCGQGALPAWQSTMVPVARESLVCVRGAEDARVRWWLEPQVLRGLVLALVGL